MSHTPKRILVVDDHVDTALSFAALLRALGHEVEAVTDSMRVEARVAELEPHIVFLDIGMPRLDGIEAARQLRRSHWPARLVFLTVHEDTDFARAALDAGGLGYVVKARLASDLLPAIREALADRRFISPTISLEENA